METTKENYQIYLRVVPSFITTNKLYAQFSGAFQQEEWERLKLIEATLRSKLSSPNLGGNQSHPKGERSRPTKSKSV